MFDFNKLNAQLSSMAIPSASEMTAYGRKQSAEAMKYIPSEEAKELMTKMSNFQWNIADMIAAPLDKAVDAIREGKFLKV